MDSWHSRISPSPDGDGHYYELLAEDGTTLMTSEPFSSLEDCQAELDLAVLHRGDERHYRVVTDGDSLLLVLEDAEGRELAHSPPFDSEDDAWALRDELLDAAEDAAQRADDLDGAEGAAERGDDEKTSFVNVADLVAAHGHHETVAAGAVVEEALSIDEGAEVLDEVLEHHEPLSALDGTSDGVVASVPREVTHEILDDALLDDALLDDATTPHEATVAAHPASELGPSGALDEASLFDASGGERDRTTISAIPSALFGGENSAEHSDEDDEGPFAGSYAGTVALPAPAVARTISGGSGSGSGSGSGASSAGPSKATEQRPASPSPSANRPSLPTKPMTASPASAGRPQSPQHPQSQSQANDGRSSGKKSKKARKEEAARLAADARKAQAARARVPATAPSVSPTSTRPAQIAASPASLFDDNDDQTVISLTQKRGERPTFKAAAPTNAPTAKKFPWGIVAGVGAVAMLLAIPLYLNGVGGGDTEKVVPKLDAVAADLALPVAAKPDQGGGQVAVAVAAVDAGGGGAVGSADASIAVTNIAAEAAPVDAAQAAPSVAAAVIAPAPTAQAPSVEGAGFEALEPAMIAYFKDPSGTAPRAFPMDKLRFAAGSVELAGAGAEQARAVAVILSRHPYNTVEVRGYSDGVESEHYEGPGARRNFTISKLRADIVLQALVHEHISIDRLRSRGVATISPAGDQLTAEGRQRNRRVEIVILDR